MINLDMRTAFGFVSKYRFYSNVKTITLLFTRTSISYSWIENLLAFRFVNIYKIYYFSLKKDNNNSVEKYSREEYWERTPGLNLYVMLVCFLQLSA